MARFETQLILTIISTFWIRQTLSANILFVQTCASYSHRPAVWPIVEGLAVKGHKVTFMSPFTSKTPTKHPNISDITPTSLNEFLEEMLASSFDVSHRAKGTVPPMWLVIDMYCYKACSLLLQSKELQDWISKTDKVDLVLGDVHPECAYGLSQKLNAKSILVLPIPVSYSYSDIFGFPHESSSIPDIDVLYKTPISFWKRMLGNIIPLWFKLVKSLVYSLAYQSVFKQDLGLAEPASYDEMNANLSLIITNADFVEDYARSYPPFVVKVPALHVKSKEGLSPLESDVDKFINSVNSTNAKSDGFIYISLGTVVNAGSMPHEIRDVFFNTIKSFTNIRFIWRWTGDLPSKELVPENLLIRPWFNQQALLAHPKILGFIFQAGRPSMEETLRYGVPTIAFPMVCDQDFNTHRLEMLGSSITLELTDLHTKPQMLHDSIRELLTNPKYMTTAKRLQNLTTDVQVPSTESAVWWIEFVLRHSQEDLNLLKSPSQQLTWYQRRDLDVWAAISLINFIVLYIVFKLTRKVFRKLFVNDERIKNSTVPNGDSKFNNHSQKVKKQ